MSRLILHGALADLVGAHAIDLEVSSPAEAVRALVVQFPRARHVIEPADWHVLADGVALDPRAFTARIGFTELELRPALSGAEGKAGPFKILAGMFLIFSAFAGAAFVGISAGTSLGGLGFSAGLRATLLGVSLGTFAKLGAVVALSGIVRTLSPSPSADFDDLEAAPGSYAFPALGQLNQQGARVPIVYGEAAVGSVVISELETVDVFIDWEADVPANTFSLYSTARLEVVDLISEGPIEGIVGGLKGVYFDSTPVESEAGGLNFPGVTLIERRGEAEPTDAGIAYVSRRFPVGLSVRYSDTPSVSADDGAVEWTVTDPLVTEVRCVLSIPALWEIDSGTLRGTYCKPLLQIKPSGGSWTTCLSPNRPYDPTVASAWLQYQTQGQVRNTVALSFALGVRGTFWVLQDMDAGTTEAQIGDPVTATVTITDTTPGTEGSHTFYIPTVFSEAATLEAAPNSAVVSNFIAARVDVDLNFFGAQPASREWDVELGSDFATRYPSSDGYELTDDSALHETTGNALLKMVSFSEVGGWLYTLSPIEMELASGDPNFYGSPPWDFRVKRTYKTDELPPDELRRDFSVKQYTEIIAVDASMPHSATAQLTIPAASTDGATPRRLYHVKGRTLRLPSGYDPEAATYPGTWAGTFAASEAWSDNPAWALFDYLTQPRYGLGLADDEIDKWGLYAASQRCDESVDAWGGGSERRYRFGHAFQTKDDALKGAVTIAAAMDATLFWADGKTYFSQAKPQDPVRIFGPANVVGGQFSYTGASRQATRTVALVGWVDPGSPGDAKLSAVERPFVEERFGRSELEIKAVGAVSEGQALRKGRYELIAGERESELVQFSVPTADLNLAPGDVIAIQDPARAGVRLSGRVKQVLGAGLLIVPDAIDHAQVSAGDSIFFAYPDGQGIHETTIDTHGSGFIGLDDALDTGRARPGMAWIITSSELELWRVIALEAGADGRYDCTGHRLDPDLWDDVEDLDDEGAPIVVTFPAAPPTPTVDVALIRRYWADPLDLTESMYVDLQCSSAGAGWFEVIVDAGDLAVVSKPRFDSSSGTFRIELTGSPSGDVFNATVQAWDIAHTATSATAAVAAPFEYTGPPPGPVAVLSETQDVEGDEVSIRLEWTMNSTAFYVITASHVVAAVPVEDARWVADAGLARFSWPDVSAWDSVRLKIEGRFPNGLTFYTSEYTV